MKIASTTTTTTTTTTTERSQNAPYLKTHERRDKVGNRNKRRIALKEQHRYVSSFPEQFVAIPREEFPALERLPVSAWKNRDYLVLLYVENNPQFPGLMRLSICRTEINGRSWKDGLTWDELQAVKHEVGFGSSYAIEVYPADRDVVNVANFRHLWLLAKPLEIGWFNDSSK